VDAGGDVVAERPDWGALHSAFDDMRKAIGGLEETQRKILKITGVAWSDDRLVKAVVGPRGQLIDLEIDPRVYRKPNSKALSATILATVRLAVDDAMAKTREFLDHNVPSDLRVKSVGGLDVRRLMSSHDGDLSREEGDDGIVVR
jgi:DNA-binding protein YbaB